MKELEREVLRYRGRVIDAAELALIRACVAAHFAHGRSRLARALCEQWQWRQPNGQFKEFAARDLLLRLEQGQWIRLPPRQRTKINYPAPTVPAVPRVDRSPLVWTGSPHAPLAVGPAEGAERELWDGLVAHFHYLGYARLVGEHVRHLAWCQDRPVAALGWASAAFTVRCRDEWIGWAAATRRQRLYLLANNVRFVVLPWVQGPHLASAVLAESVARLSADWQARYGHPVVLAETFVDPARFAGTCYRAANWRRLGQSRGSAKRGNDYHAHGRPKTVWVYPLCRQWRERLLG